MKIKKYLNNLAHYSYIQGDEEEVEELFFVAA